MTRSTEHRRPAYLGFAAKIMGRPELKSHDARRWQSDPHLGVSLGYLAQIFEYLEEADIHMYRMASGLAPYATHPEMTQFHGQVEECEDVLANYGETARRQGLRLSFHPGQFVVLNSPDDDLVNRSLPDVEVQAAILDAMGLDDEAVVVLHVGGVYGDPIAARERFARTFERLSAGAQRRLVLENDDVRFGVEDVLWLNRAIGVRVVFDAHHHLCHNPTRMPASDAVRACLDTWEGWPARPKIHFSSPRTDWGYRQTSEEKRRSPDWTAHAEFIDPFAFIAFYRRISGIAPDVMIEAKAKDLALIQLRRDLARYAPDLAEVISAVEKELSSS